MVVLKPKFNIYSLLIWLTIPVVLILLGAKGWIIGPLLIFIYRPLSLLFIRYKLSTGGILIKELWVKTEIPIRNIQGIKDSEIPPYKQLFTGYPSSFTVIKFNRFDEANIYLPREVIEKALAEV